MWPQLVVYMTQENMEMHLQVFCVDSMGNLFDKMLEKKLVVWNIKHGLGSYLERKFLEDELQSFFPENVTNVCLLKDDAQRCFRCWDEIGEIVCYRLYEDEG